MNTVAGRVSDAALRERSGRGWNEWFALLDAWGATSRNHTQIARWLGTTHGVDTWTAQTVSVGYEHARGMRAPGQQSNGAFVASVSRTMAVPAARAFEAFVDESVRERWLVGAKLRVSSATPPRTLRADWIDDGTRILVAFTPKGDARTEVSVVHEKLVGSDAVAERKDYWRERLTALRTLLGG